MDRLKRIDAADIDLLLTQAIAEQWQQIAFIGPDVWLSEKGESRPDSLKFAERVFHLNSNVKDFAGKLQSLPCLTSLCLWGCDIDAEGARAIASLHSLTSLNLDSNDIGIEGARAIASLHGLTSLNLSANNIGNEGARAIASLHNLTSLNLSANNIGNEGARAIASLHSLTSLNLSANNIGNEGTRAIALSLRNLTSLDLGNNDIGTEGARAIAASLHRLTSLHLRVNAIGAEGARVIAASLHSLTSLDLDSNDIGDEGARAIASSLRGLTSLHLNRNGIGDAGVHAIATSLHSLTSLHLSSNKIGDEGAQAIAGSLHSLTSLDLEFNEIGAEGARAIAASLHSLTSLDLGFNGIGEDGARAIAASLHGLKSLDLTSNRIGAKGARAIAASLLNLTSLDLSGNKIGDQGAQAIAGSLHGLTSLNLGHNEIGDEGARAIATSLHGLTSLNLGSNKIGADGARTIATSLHGLTFLYLAENKIGDNGARAIAASLRGLTSLYLGSNGIGAEGARVIATSLHGLQSLQLGYNRIGAEGARAIAASLHRLTWLNLDDSEIGDDGARAIAASLHALTSLQLNSNRIGAEGARAIAASLHRLIWLELHDNEIGDEGARAIAASLHTLTSLRLDRNQIGDEGARAIAASLHTLTWLCLGRNRIGDDGARAIAASLHRLTWLELNDNDFSIEGGKALLDSWLQEPRSGRLVYLKLAGNNLGHLLPKEVLETTDAQSILAAYRRFTLAEVAQTLRPLNELKLIVVGNEAVGKTSLLRYLIEGKPRDPNETKTPGVAQHEKIEIRGWSPDDCHVRLNVWDFGGQEMMRGTHRFFLTERSLYLLVLEDRRQDDRSVYDWMKTIRNRGGDSPVIVVINKSDNGKQDLRLDENGLKEAYPSIAAFLRTSCDPGEWAGASIEGLRRTIVETIIGNDRLKHVRDPIPENWLQIKDRVRALANERSVLPHADFVSLCRDTNGGADAVADDSEQRVLLRLLHDLGAIVAHGLERDAPAVRREITLLDPNWLTGAVYRILDKASSVDQEGEFLRRQLPGWLDPRSYPPEWHEFILDRMQDREIGLCFRLPALAEEGYLIPEALPANRRFYGKWPEDSLRFRYLYNFLPPGLIPRFIVESHRHLTPEKSRWRTGVVLRVRDCDVLVLADVDQRRVDIQVTGSSALRRAALNVVLDDLEAVHELNPEADPLAVVALPDHPDVHVGYDYLLTLEREEGPGFSFRPEGTIHLPAGATRRYTVGELLEGVRRDVRNQPRKADTPRQSTKPHVVILVHGIRTRALWQSELRKVLQNEGFVVQPTNYGYFDVVRFLIPWQPFAGTIVDEITRQIRHTLRMNEGAECSIIAHSFGTFVVSRILQKHTDLKFNRIIFCGSVVSYRFPFEDYDGRFKSPLVNEVGTRDFWPVMAEVVTFGYGSAGTYGFRRPAVHDRWHNGKAHGDFLNQKFCMTYWAPFLRNGQIVEDDEAAESPPWWLWVVSTFQINYVVIAAACVWLWRWLTAW